MIKGMLTRGAAGIVGIIVTQAIIDKVEKASANRKERKKNKSKKEKQYKVTVQNQETGEGSVIVVDAINREEALDKADKRLGKTHRITDIGIA